MTWRRQMALSEAERAAFSATAAFLEGRLESRETIDWALGLTPRENVQRLALLAVLDRASTEMAEPWRHAWRLIEEFWDEPPEERSSTEAYRIRQRLAEGDRSGALIAKMAGLLAPRLNITALGEVGLRARRIPTRPRTIQHLFSTGLTSNDLIDPSLWGVATLEDAMFVGGLARALDSSLTRALDLAKRLGWDGATRLWALGDVRRVYYADRPGEERSDPDQYGHGVAPCIKMLHAAVSRLAEVAPSDAMEFMRRWDGSKSPIYMRLWASLARDGRLAPSTTVEQFFAGLDAAQFWDLNRFPEIAELRARRFAELGNPAQIAIAARLERKPPRTQWRRDLDRGSVDNARLYWSVREFRRIESAGAQLPPNAHHWLATNIGQFPEFAGPVAIDEGFLGGVEVHSSQPTPDSRYDQLAGQARLLALESGLNAARVHWDDDPAEGARAWISDAKNWLSVLSDLETTGDGGSAFPHVWQRFGWGHSPANPPITALPREHRIVADEATRVLALIELLSDDTVSAAISGISHWLSAWEALVISTDAGLRVWRKVWPLAVAATNAEQSSEDEFDLGIVARDVNGREPMDLDTLNTPAGKLVGVFIAAWSAENEAPFADGKKPKIMRDIIIESEGRSGLVSKHRMIELLAFFQNSAPEWTENHLLPLLKSDSPATLPLWRAVSRRRIYSDTINLLGEELLTRTTDQRLGRESRKSLVFSIVVQSLHAFLSNKEQPVQLPRLQQLLRSLDDEVRAHAAEAIHRFVRDSTGGTREQHFRDAAAPFLRTVWPQERSLSTPGVSQALADLPAAAGEAFEEAVDVIERFLVPFECWSLIEYGLYGEDEEGEAKLSSINTATKAKALLTLLDRTIGAAEGATVPYGLADALAQIRRIAPTLEATQEFRRLSTAAR